MFFSSAMRRQSSYSGEAVTSFPSRVPTLTRTGPNGVSTVAQLARELGCARRGGGGCRRWWSRGRGSPRRGGATRPATIAQSIHAGPRFLHLDRRRPGVERAGGEELLEGVADDLGGRVVEVDLEHPGRVRLGRAAPRCAEHQPQDVRMVRVVAPARAVADALDPQRARRPLPAERGQDRRAGRGEQFARHRAELALQPGDQSAPSRARAPAACRAATSPCRRPAAASRRTPRRRRAARGPRPRRRCPRSRRARRLRGSGSSRPARHGSPLRPRRAA